MTDILYRFSEVHGTFKFWTFHKGEAKREEKVGKFGFKLTIEERKNIEMREFIFLPTVKKKIGYVKLKVIQV